MVTMCTFPTLSSCFRDTDFCLLSSLAQAKTGTGKTLAFLVPVIQNIMKDLKSQPQSKSSYRRRPSSKDIRAIVISPTRELAEQIATEALKVSRGTGIVVQTAVGGTQRREKLRAIQREGCHLLIGTPGRLKDILSDPTTGVSAPRLSSFVLDEADRLLDEGFAPDIMEIQTFLPNRKEVDRQTLMFSATVPKEVMGMVRKTMKRDFRFVKTVREDEVPTHFRVPQKAIVLPGLENALPAVLEMSQNQWDQWTKDRSQRPFKAIIYFNSTAEVKLAFEAFMYLRRQRKMGGLGVFDIHSRLTQAARTRNADSFRKTSTGILLSSDVTARGMDFPEVTHVIQVGVPRDTPTYIHRLGRTGRANKEGEGLIMFHEDEMRTFKNKLGELPIQMDETSLPTSRADLTDDKAEHEPAVSNILTQLQEAMENTSYHVKEEAYKSQFGTLLASFYNKSAALDAINKLAVHGYGLLSPPPMSPFLLEKMGLNKARGAREGRSNPMRRALPGMPGRNSRPRFVAHSQGSPERRDDGGSWNDRRRGVYHGEYRERRSRNRESWDDMLRTGRF